MKGKKMRKQIEHLVDGELERANKKFPMFQSDHEGYAVILEELQELNEDVINLFTKHDDMWDSIKINTSWKEEAVEDMKRIAINSALEAIQVAAMCQMFIDSREKRE